MNINQLVIMLAVIALVIYAVFRQVTERQVKKFSFVIFPVIAAYEAYNLFPHSTVPSSQILQCMLTVLVGLAAGAMQAAFTKVYYKEDKLYMRGGKETLIAWLALFVFRIVIRLFFLGGKSPASLQSTEWILFAGMAVTFGVRSILMYLKHPEIRRFFQNGAAV